MNKEEMEVLNDLDIKLELEKEGHILTYEETYAIARLISEYEDLQDEVQELKAEKKLLNGEYIGVKTIDEYIEILQKQTKESLIRGAYLISKELVETRNECFELQQKNRELKDRNDKAIVTLISWGEALEPLFQSTMLDTLEGSDRNNE